MTHQVAENLQPLGLLEGVTARPVRLDQQWQVVEVLAPVRVADADYRHDQSGRAIFDDARVQHPQHLDLAALASEPPPVREPLPDVIEVDVHESSSVTSWNQ